MKVLLYDPRNILDGLDPIAYGSHNYLVHCASHTKKHERTDDLASADIIFMGLQSPFWGPCFEVIRGDRFYRTYREKLWVYCPDDKKFPALRGLYPSITKKWVEMGWSASAHYLSSHIYQFRFTPEEISKKDIWCSFVGSSRTNAIREKMFRDLRSDDIFLLDSSSSNEPYWWEKKDANELRSTYREVLARSHFVLCPRGVSPSAQRLFEIMESGSVPVIISDDIVLPVAPRWDEFSVRIPEDDIRNIPGRLKEIKDVAAMRKKARQAWEDFFSVESSFDYLMGQVGDLMGKKVSPLAAKISEWTDYRIMKSKLRFMLKK